MANVVKKYGISSELAQKMVDEAVAKAREIGVSENAAILDDGGNLKAFSQMDGAPILSIEIAQNKAYTALFGIPTQEFFNFIQGDPSLLAGIPTLARVAAYGGGFPIKVDGEIVGAIGVSGGPTVQNDVDCARAVLALVPDAMHPLGHVSWDVSGSPTLMERLKRALAAQTTLGVVLRDGTPRRRRSTGVPCPWSWTARRVLESSNVLNPRHGERMRLRPCPRAEGGP